MQSTGRWRRITEYGKLVIAHAFNQGGYNTHDPLLVRKLPAVVDGFEYEVIDGNHRVAVLMEHGLGDMEWDCRVIKVLPPSNLLVI